jgi:hypothetical protein
MLTDEESEVFESVWQSLGSRAVAHSKEDTPDGIEVASEEFFDEVHSRSKELESM